MDLLIEIKSKLENRYRGYIWNLNLEDKYLLLQNKRLGHMT